MAELQIPNPQPARPTRGGVSGFFSDIFFGDAPTPREQEYEISRLKEGTARRKHDLEYQGKVRDLLEAAYDRFAGPDDKPELNATLQSIFKSIEQETGRKVSPVLQKYLTDPQKAKELLEFSRTEGITLGDIFNMTGDPLATAGAMVAYGKARQKGRFAAALPGAEGAPAGPSAPAAAGVPVPETGAAPTAVAGAEPAPTGPHAAAVSRIDARLKFLEGARARAVAAAPDPQSRTAALKLNDEEIKQLLDDRSKLTTGRTLDIEKEDRTPATETEISQARLDAQRSGLAAPVVARMFPYGLERGKLKERSNLVTAEGGGQTAAPRAAGGAGGAAPAASTALTPEAQRFENELTTTRLGAQVRGREEVNSARLRKWGEAADNTEKRRGMLGTMETLLNQAGDTGELVGPLRSAFNNVAQLAGVTDATKLNELQLFDRLNKQLATESLRDFSGPDSDKDVLRAIELNPGIRNTRAANRALIAIHKTAIDYDQDRVLNARRWVAQYGSLSESDPTGKTFDEVWTAHANKKRGVGRGILEKAGIKIPKNP